ncbi:MAG: hypothetical protein IIX09_00625, partial [Clostridia bacterium]|nr:hypothetical protein [Clostridia bacterium]
EVLRSAVILMVMCIAATPYPAKMRERLLARGGVVAKTVDVVLLLLGIILSVAVITASDYSPFLYTNF